MHNYVYKYLYYFFKDKINYYAHFLMHINYLYTMYAYKLFIHYVNIFTIHFIYLFNKKCKIDISICTNFKFYLYLIFFKE